MERKKDQKKDQKKAKKNAKGIRFRKINGGSFRMKNGRIIKPGQVFDAKWEDIPEAFRDSIRPLNPDEVKEAKKENVKDKVSKYFIQAGARGWYDVVDADGKKQNEKNLRRADAEELLDSLS